MGKGMSAAEAKKKPRYLGKNRRTYGERKLYRDGAKKTNNIRPEFQHLYDEQGRLKE